MRYVSTRGEAPILDFEGVLLQGLARDGGLYVPESWPSWSADALRGLRGRSYEEIALQVMTPFVGDAIAPERLSALVEKAYVGFRHPARAPLAQIADDRWLLELHHGATLAFKDFAMQLIGQLFEEVLTRRGRRATIIGATSGDTGSAAMEAFRGLDQVDVFILFPHGRVSDVQRRQMTTPPEPNVHALAVEGSFDDCQALVKAMFADHAFAERMALGAVNSINWARVAAQIVYYVSSAVALGAPDRPVSYSVPTGNFGDIFAGWSARRMGLSIDQLIIATNENDILFRTWDSGAYAPQAVKRTSSPSMDIQVSSNFERALFELHGRDAAATRGLMADLKEDGAFTLSSAAHDALRSEFQAARASEADVAATIAATYRETGHIIDPHTAVGVAAAKARAGEGDPAAPMVCLACAHAAKFGDAVEAATGVSPSLPPHLSDLFDRPERLQILPNDLTAVQAHLSAHARN